MPIFSADAQLHYFAHVPKCGGTAVENHLEARFGALAFLQKSFPERLHNEVWYRCSPQHVPWQDCAILFPQGWIASSFGIVRHPVARFVSGYNMRATAPGEQIFSAMGIEEFFDWMLRLRDHDPFFQDNHFQPQHKLIPPEAKIFKLEDGLDAVETYLDEKFGKAPGVPSISFVTQTHHDADAFDMVPGLSASLMEKLAAFYAKDFAQFGYAIKPASEPKVARLKSGASTMALRSWRLRRKARLVFNRLRGAR